MIRLQIAILYLLLGSVACNNTETPLPSPINTTNSIDAPTETIAGDAIIIEAHGDDYIPALKLWNSIGSTLIEGTAGVGTTQYAIPSSYCKISGVLRYCLGKTCGEINILPTEELASLEGYIGPTTAVTGDRGSYMMVGIGTDKYDNTVQEHTAITANNYRDGKVSSRILQSKNGIVHNLYDSGTTVGNASMSLNHQSITTQEYKVAIGPNEAQPYAIRAITEHNKADGNSLISFKTDLIKDAYGNAIADGSLITWFVSGTGSKSVLKSYTIDGRSTVEITHPAQAEIMEISASIGQVNSNTIILQFESGLQSYEIAAENQIIKIGPMRSYLGQYIPDGFPIEIRVLAGEQTIVDWISLQSKDGYAQYDISPHINLQNGTDQQHKIEVRSGGITQSLQLNWDE